jgi:hypothetical protein
MQSVTPVPNVVIGKEINLLIKGDKVKLTKRNEDVYEFLEWFEFPNTFQKITAIIKNGKIESFDLRFLNQGYNVAWTLSGQSTEDTCRILRQFFIEILDYVDKQSLPEKTRENPREVRRKMNLELGNGSGNEKV